MNEISIRELMCEFHRDGELTVIGVTGQAGAGKSSFITPLIEESITDLGFKYCALSLDDFFILSSHDRKKWLEEVILNEKQRAYRQNLLNWWDFGLLQKTIAELRNGAKVHLQNVYDRTNSGELTGDKIITPPSSGFILLEGVAIAHLSSIDKLIFVFASDTERLMRLKRRDVVRKNPNEVDKRFDLCQRFSKRYFLKYRSNVDIIIQNNNKSNVKTFKMHSIDDWINLDSMY